MKDFLTKQEKYYCDFADVIMAKFLSMKYGVGQCHKDKDINLLTMRKELSEWQSNHDHGALSERVRINYLTWLPVRVDHEEIEGGAGYCYNESTAPNSATVQYTYGNVSQNIVEVNAGGCITRININPNITINNQTGAISFHQTTPSSIWTLVHGLGFNPNITTTDEVGQEILGIVTYLDSNTIKVEFTNPVAGYAYLS